MSDIIERAEGYMAYEHPRVGANRSVPAEMAKELVAELKAARGEDESPYPTQAQMDAEDAQEMYRLAAYLSENHDDTRLACEPVVDWAIRLLTDWRPS